MKPAACVRDAVSEIGTCERCCLPPHTCKQCSTLNMSRRSIASQSRELMKQERWLWSQNWAVSAAFALATTRFLWLHVARSKSRSPASKMDSLDSLSLRRLVPVFPLQPTRARSAISQAGLINIATPPCRSAVAAAEAAAAVSSLDSSRPFCCSSTASCPSRHMPRRTPCQ